MYRKSILGKKFGELIVIKPSKKKCRKSHDTYWICRCGCGKEKHIRRAHLINGKVKSCGCKQFQLGSKHPCWSGYGEFSGVFFGVIKRGARLRNLDFDITKKYIWDLFLSQNRKCALTGLELNFSTLSGGKDGNASLDRIDSSKGYIKDNVWWVHKDINRMKLEFSLDKFYDYCKLVTEKKKAKV